MPIGAEITHDPDVIYRLPLLDAQGFGKKMNDANRYNLSIVLTILARNNPHPPRPRPHFPNDFLFLITSVFRT